MSARNRRARPVGLDEHVRRLPELGREDVVLVRHDVEPFVAYRSDPERHQLEAFLSKLDRRKALLEQQREDVEVMLREVEFFALQCRTLLQQNEKQTAKAAQGLYANVNVNAH